MLEPQIDDGQKDPGLMAERQYGAPAPETHAMVTGADWSGEDISRQNHTRILFVDLDMTEVRSTGAVFTECTFRRARFNASAHQSAAFVNCGVVTRIRARTDVSL